MTEEQKFDKMFLALNYGDLEVIKEVSYELVYLMQIETLFRKAGLSNDDQVERILDQIGYDEPYKVFIALDVFKTLSISILGWSVKLAPIGSTNMYLDFRKRYSNYSLARKEYEVI